MRRIAIGIGLLAIAATAACDDDGLGIIDDDELFFADLTGGNEVPPVETDAAADAAFEWDGTRVLFEIVATAPITDVIAAHIHDGEAGVNGDILVTLYDGPTVDLEAGEPLVADGEFSSTNDDVDLTLDELVELMRASDVYVNVHTEANPGGEIRGQIIPVDE